MINLFFNFGPLPNFVKGEARHFKFGIQTDQSFNQRMMKYPQKGCGQGYGTSYFGI